MSILINSTLRFVRQQLFDNTMDKTMRIIRLEERLSKTESAVRKLQTEIESMKQELQSLKNTEDQPDSKRSFSSFSFDDLEEPVPANKKSKSSFTKNDGYVVVYTDGACLSNGKTVAKAGIGVWFGHNHPLNIAMPCPGRQTNNSAEILACAEACKVAAANGIDKLEINTDSQFAINCVTKWMDNWKKNNWKTSSGKDAINKDELLILEMYAQALSDVKYVHVRGHKGIEGNEAADKLAVQGAST